MSFSSTSIWVNGTKPPSNLYRKMNVFKIPKWEWIFMSMLVQSKNPKIYAQLWRKTSLLDCASCYFRIEAWKSWMCSHWKNSPETSRDFFNFQVNSRRKQTNFWSLKFLIFECFSSSPNFTPLSSKSKLKCKKTSHRLPLSTVSLWLSVEKQQ